MQIQIADINKRINSLNSSISESRLQVKNISPINEAGVYSHNTAKYMIECWRNIDSDSNVAFEKALDVYEVMYEHESTSVIRDIGSILIEGVQKVRDANQLMNSIKHRTSRIKSKISTKINNKIDDVDNANNEINDKIRAALDSLKNNSPSSDGDSSSSNDEFKDKAVIDVYNKLYEAAHKSYECDRILRNYNSISKRFDLYKMVSESLNTDGDLDSCIIKICECVDTFSSSFQSKYNTMLETTAYIFDRMHVEYPRKRLVEMVTNYFIFNIDTPIEEAETESIKKVKSNSVIFSDCDFDSIEYLIKGEPEKIKESDINILNAVSSYGTEYVSSTNEGVLKDWSKGNPSEHDNDDIKKMVNDFRDSCKANQDSASNISHFKALVNKIFTKNPTQITTELPNLLSILRLFFILGSASIHPVIGILTLITDQIIKVELERKQLTRIIDQYTKEIDKVKANMEKAKSDDEKDRLKKYLDELKKDLDKIKAYERDLYSEEENEERQEDDDMEDYDFDDDFDFDDDEDWDLDDIDESTINLASIEYISSIVSNINEALIDTDLDGIVYNNIFRFDNDTLDAITDFSVTVPVILEKDKLKSALENHRQDLRESNFMGNIMRINCINDNIRRLEESSSSYNVMNNMKGLICTLNCINDIVTTTKIKTMMEMDFSNTIKLAMNRLKKNAVKLSDKEKKISKDIDVSMASISRGLEEALRNDNREAIIKGRILPSASKTIKIALATGAAWAVSPAVAVIGALGAFACSSKLKAKERQLVLDDIEIELKMCERYLKMAEDKEDMEAIRQIETTQRNLERQRQRIKYKMNVVYNQKVPDVANRDDYE